MPVIIARPKDRASAPKIDDLVFFLDGHLGYLAWPASKETENPGGAPGTPA